MCWIKYIFMCWIKENSCVEENIHLLNRITKLLKDIKPCWLDLRHFDVNDIYIDFIQIEMNIEVNWNSNRIEIRIKLK